MKLFKSLILLGLVFGAAPGVVLAANKAEVTPVQAEVTLDEPDGDIKLEADKIKGYTEHHFELLEGPSGDTVDAYVFSAEGNTAKNPEIRFVTAGTQTVTKPYDLVAEETTEVHFWYKLSNTSEKNVDDGSWPYLLQVLGTDGTYPLHPWTPVVDGEWHLEILSTDDYHDKFAGMLVKMGDINGSLTIANIKTYSTEVVDLMTVFPATFSGTFLYSAIQNYFFDINLSQRIFSTKAYINDHYNEFLGPDGEVIPLLQGIVVNGKTFAEWKAYHSESVSFPRNDGVTAFPLYAGNTFNPLSIETGTTRLSFKMNQEEIPMDGMTVTFKAGLFYGYYENKTFVLDQDLTYYSVVSDTGAPARVTFSQVKTWEETRLGVNHVDNWGDQTAPRGGIYKRYVIWTDIPFDPDVITQGCPADNYRYIYGNVLMNGKPIVHYTSWARGNSKDFTDLADPSTQNPDYEINHPLGEANINYDMGVSVTIIRNQPCWTLFIDVPNQLVTDMGLGALTFALRDGSDWMSSRGGDVVIYRYNEKMHDDYAAVKAFVDNNLHMEDYNDALGWCKDEEHHYYLTAKAALNTLTEDQVYLFRTHPDFEEARFRYEGWAGYNNDAKPYDGNDTVVTTLYASKVTLANNSTSTAIIVLLVATSVSVIAVGALYFLRKRKAK